VEAAGLEDDDEADEDDDDEEDEADERALEEDDEPDPAPPNVFWYHLRFTASKEVTSRSIRLRYA